MKKIYITIVLLSFITAPLIYPQRISIGPNIGLNYNFHSVKYTDVGSVGSVNGFGMLAGAQIEFMFTPVIGLVTNLQFYDNRSATVDYNYKDQVTRLNQNNQNQLYNVTVTGDGSFGLSYFTIEAAVKLAVPGGLFFTLGPAIGIKTSATDTWNQVIDFNPYNYTEKDVGSQDVKDTNTRFELKGGIGYDIEVGRGMFLTPQVGFAYGFGDVKDMKDMGSWTVSTLQAMLTYRFVLAY